MVDSLAEKRRHFPEIIDPAFELAGSEGMGHLSRAISTFAAGVAAPNWIMEAMGGAACNYLTNPYVFTWTGRKDVDPGLDIIGPYATSPYSDLHVKLLNETRDEYARLRRAQFRFFLGGEEALLVPDAEAPFTDRDEFTRLLLKANQRGLIEADPNILSGVEITDNENRLPVVLARAGVEVRDELYDLSSPLKLVQTDRFRKPLLRAAAHKLGSMLALTDQLIFDAQALRVPIPPTYRPARVVIEWQNLLNESMPDLEGLYEQSYTVFVANADPSDSLVAHLFELDHLPQY